MKDNSSRFLVNDVMTFDLGICIYFWGLLYLNFIGFVIFFISFVTLFYLL